MNGSQIGEVGVLGWRGLEKKLQAKETLTRLAGELVYVLRE